ncbi:MAG TPA: 16S rRNA (cytosine(1402)-N(4))-methyltransferase RsmH [Ktedonobacteraceae bacterium]
MTTEHSQHTPVMVDEVVRYLQPHSGGYYIDATLGGGGHTAAILEHSAPRGCVLGIDADPRALERVRFRLDSAIEAGRLVLVHSNFAELDRVTREFHVPPVQGVLLDLGFSSDQMADPQRGLSFSVEGPLDMRFDPSLAISAADIINTASEEELADIFWKYGEERRSRQIAWRIVQERIRQPLTRTTQLAALVAAGVPRKAGAIHPATRVFQALRIAVNHELERLETVLPHLLDVLSAPQNGEVGGRVVIISFHSLEDRIVKEFMRHEARDCICPPHTPVCVCGHKARIRLLTRKPVTASEQEVMLNPRARSAKLRVAELL